MYQRSWIDLIGMDIEPAWPTGPYGPYHKNIDFENLLIPYFHPTRPCH